MKERTRGATLVRLDISTIEAEASARQDKYDRVECNYEWAAGMGQDGNLYVICSEGVGYPVTDDAPFELEMWGRNNPDSQGSTTLSMFPSMTAQLSPAEVREIMTGETVDLADFVRVFGARLERNFDIWFTTLVHEEVSA